MDLKALSAGEKYAALRPATRPTGQQGGSLFGRAVEDFSSTLARSEAMSEAATTTGVDPHALVEALAQTELAVETAVTVRNKVVEAYQEILRMPI